MKDIIQKYLYFLTKENFVFLNEKDSQVKVALLSSSFAMLWKLREENVLKFTIDCNAQGQTLTTLTEVNFEQLEKLVLERMRQGMYLLAYLLGKPVDVQMIDKQLTLGVSSLTHISSQLPCEGSYRVENS